MKRGDSPIDEKTFGRCTIPRSCIQSGSSQSAFIDNISFNSNVGEHFRSAVTRDQVARSCERCVWGGLRLNVRTLVSRDMVCGRTS